MFHIWDEYLYLSGREALSASGRGDDVIISYTIGVDVMLHYTAFPIRAVNRLNPTQGGVVYY